LRRIEELEARDRQNGIAENVISSQRYQRTQNEEIKMIEEAAVAARIYMFEQRKVNTVSVNSEKTFYSYYADAQSSSRPTSPIKQGPQLNNSVHSSGHFKNNANNNNNNNISPIRSVRIGGPTAMPLLSSSSSSSSSPMKSRVFASRDIITMNDDNSDNLSEGSSRSSNSRPKSMKLISTFARNPLKISQTSYVDKVPEF
jgi:hypothetical protein